MPGTPVACLHVDATPAGVDVAREVPTTEARRRAGAGPSAVAAAAEAGAPAPAAVGTGAAVACDGDGASGYRIQAVYVVAADRPNRYATLLPSIQQWAAGVDDVLNRSAALTGGVRRLRYATQANGDGTCTPTVLNVTVPTGANASFGSTINAVRALGHTSAARKYLMWVDATVLCGVAQLYPSSTDGQGNANNGSYSQMARIDSGCWGLSNSVEAHELVHMLGAVMPDAPHKSAAGHCTDESDRLCYTDGAGVSMQQVCAPANEALLDCNGDDYFSTFPAAGSWLDTHWNAADSRFLIGGGDGSGGGQLGLPTTLGLSVAVNNPALPGLATQVTASPQLPAGRTASVLWRSARADCVFSSATSLQSTVTCGAGSLVPTTVTVTATDSTGATATATGALTFSSEPRTVTSTLLVDGREGTAYSGCTGGGVYLTVTVLDATSEAPVKGVKVSFLRRVGTTTTVLATGTTDITGVARSTKVIPLAGSALSARTTLTTTMAAASSPETQVSTTSSCPTSLTAAPSVEQSGYAAPVTVTGRLLKTSGGETDGAAGEVVTVRLLAIGALTPTTLGTATTTADGTWTARVVPKTSGQLYATFPGKTAYLPAMSSPTTLSVATWVPELTLISVTPTALAYGGTVAVSGTATRTAFDVTEPAAGVRITISQVTVSGVETVLGSTTTTSAGTFSASVRPTWSATLRARVTGVAGYLNTVAAEEPAVSVGLALSLAPSTTAPVRGAPVTWTLRSTPARSVTVALERQVGGVWSTVTTTALVNGLAKVVVTAPSTAGMWPFRLTFAGDDGHAASTGAVKAFRTT